MIKKLAQKSTYFYSSHGIIDVTQHDSYIYSFELLFSTVFNFIGIAIVSWLAGNLLYGALFVPTFLTIRLSAGGYHAKRHITCILGFNFIYVGFCMSLVSLPISLCPSYIAAAALNSLILILLFSPVEAPNKPLQPYERKRQRKRSIALASLIISIALIASLFFSRLLPLICWFISGLLCASLLLPYAKLHNSTASMTS